MLPLVITNYRNDFDQFDRNIKRSGTNQPEERQEKIYNKLVGKYPIYVPNIELTKNIIIGLNAHDYYYLTFLEKAYETFLENPDKDYLKPDGIIPYHFSRRKSFQSNHNSAYWKQIGYYCDDVMTPINSDTYKISMESANNCYVAVNMLKLYDCIYCLNTYPGHHAMFAGYGGYCYLNNAYICAKALVVQDYKVAVLDLDYHAGNGIQEILILTENYNNILSVSIHADPKYEYPTFSGFLYENTNNHHNIIFAKKASWIEYKICLDRALTMINKFNPDVIIVPFGGDTYKDDKDASELYGCSLELDDYVKMGNEINKLKKKVIVTQEGGYCMDMMPKIIDNLLEGLTS